MGLFDFLIKGVSNVNVGEGACICKDCGQPFDSEEAANEFNAHFDEEYDYDYNGWEGYCAECAICGQENMEEEEYDENNPPPGCRDCGGPYPMCKDGCPMYDDE